MRARVLEFFNAELFFGKRDFDEKIKRRISRVISGLADSCPK